MHSEAGRSRLDARQDDFEGSVIKRAISPVWRCAAVGRVRSVLGVSEQRTCRVLGQPRVTQLYVTQAAADEDPLRVRTVALVSEYGWYGCRHITALLRDEEGHVNHK